MEGLFAVSALAALALWRQDVAEAGGWKDTQTLLKSYQQTDEATLTHVMLEAPKLTAEAGGRREVTPLLTPPRGETGERRAANE